MFAILSDFFTNISAGFFGVIFIGPHGIRYNRKEQLLSMAIDVFLMFFCLFISYKLKQL